MQNLVYKIPLSHFPRGQP